MLRIRKWSRSRTPSSEEMMQLIQEHQRSTGKSDDDIVREILTRAIENGIDVFRKVPADVREQMELAYPDILELSEKRFGGQSLEGPWVGTVPSRWRKLSIRSRRLLSR